MIVKAADLLLRSETPPEIAPILADVVLKSVRGGAAAVTVDFVGVAWASSGFFNKFLLILRESLGQAVLQSAIVYRFASRVQEGVFRRSWEALCGMPLPDDRVVLAPSQARN